MLASLDSVVIIVSWLQAG